jgi:hypothetical protein
MDDQVVAGAQDAAKELGYEITATTVSHEQDVGTFYGFTFDTHGQQTSVEFVVNKASVNRFGLTLRDYARWEILDALRKPRG